MAMGPVEVIAVGFPGSQFNGGIIPELQKLVDGGVITIIDGLLATKDESGEVALAELGEADDDSGRLRVLAERIDGLVSDEDVAELTADLEPGSSAAILVFENTWMKPLRDAIVGSSGVLLSNVRVPGSVVEEILETVPDED